MDETQEEQEKVHVTLGVNMTKACPTLQVGNTIIDFPSDNIDDTILVLLQIKKFCAILKENPTAGDAQMSFPNLSLN